MQVVWDAIQPIWKVLLVGLAAGAGLPLIFALGMRFLSQGTTVSADGMTTTGKPNQAGLIGAGLCFLIVIGAVVLGIMIIVGTKTFPFLKDLGLS